MSLTEFPRRFLHWFSWVAILVSVELIGKAAPTSPPDLPAEIEYLQPGLKLTLLAEHPELVTPTGVDVDATGKIWLILSHTHFRTSDYQGPIHDEIVVYDGDGGNRRLFYDKTDLTMNIKLGKDGWVYLSLRDRLIRVKDTDGDGRGDAEENLAVLETAADYPHNGLSGLAWLPSGELLFSAGTNAAVAWTLVGQDGTRLSGTGEGGIFRCAPDGSGLRSVSRGFWNPFGLLVRTDGEMFAVDNDPGNRPPCRLLNIFEGADYGYQRTYGDVPFHPFVAWNGELRGTLGMVHPVSEGPCAVVDFGGGLLVPSWSSHCLDYFTLKRSGAGYVSKRLELLRGSEYFRPSFIAQAPDGSFVLTDWVLSSYPVHGHGRLWRLDIDRAQTPWFEPHIEPLNSAATLAIDIRKGTAQVGQSLLFEYARGADPYLSDAALTALARESLSWSTESVCSLDNQDRPWALVALRRANLHEDKWVRALIDDANGDVQFECLRWIADAQFTGMSSEVEQMLTRPNLDYRLFEAVLATRNILRGNSGTGIADKDLLLELLTNHSTPATLKGYALRMSPASDSRITIPFLQELLTSPDHGLKLDIVRNLGLRRTEEANDLLATIAMNESYSTQMRAEAISGLAGSVKQEHSDLLIQFSSHPLAALRNESLRGLRQKVMHSATLEALPKVAKQYPDSAPMVDAVIDPNSINKERPETGEPAAWLQRLDELPGKADVENGERVFHSMAAQCATCHRHSGRGNAKGVGPDLTAIALQGTRLEILRSILEPSREVAPEFYSTTLLLEDGTVFNGILRSSADVEIYLDREGKDHIFQLDEIIESKASQTSLMPTGLASVLTDVELRDLLAFLVSKTD